MDLRFGRSSTAGAHWTVMTDVAIAMFLILILYIVVQFLRDFERRYVDEELGRRQKAVRDLVLASVGPEYALGVSFDSISPEQLRITFTSDVLFAVCRDDLRPSGRELLRRVGLVLADSQHFFRSVQIDGHTDSVPIALRGDCPFPSNWELSSARATRVVRLFSETSGVANDRLSAVGKAEFQPADSTNRNLNRRIEISLQYDRSVIESELHRSRDSGS